MFWLKDVFSCSAISRATRLERLVSVLIRVVGSLPVPVRIDSVGFLSIILDL